MLEKFDIDDNRIFKVCVIATMSSGKSTFINSILGDEVMPEKNEACTARTMAVLDNDNAVVKKAHIIRNDGSKEIVEIDNREILDHLNSDEDIRDFLIETDIESIKNTSRALVLVDTPGVNNSEDARHGERTEEFLSQLDMGVIVYLMNATQLATNDDSLLLQQVIEHVKKQNGRVKIIFVINKIDALDLEKESIMGTVKRAKDYIVDHGIEKPIVYPLSARAAKSLRMILYDKEMTKRERRNCESVYLEYKSSDNNMMDFAMLEDMMDRTITIGEDEITVQQLKRAIDNTGITAIEKRLEAYMMELDQHYAPEVVIKSSLSQSKADAYQSRVDNLLNADGLDNYDEIENCKKLIDNVFDEKEDEEIIPFELDASNPEISKFDLDLLLENIEKSKKFIYENYNKQQLVKEKGYSKRFLVPEKNSEKYIRAKKLFLCSEISNKWSEVHFGHFNRCADEGITILLFNKVDGSVIRIEPSDVADMIALLDKKLAVSELSIPHYENAEPTLSYLSGFLNQILKENEQEKEELQHAEDVLKRSYKGVTFASVEERDKAIVLENEMKDFCQNLNNQSFDNLYQKKQELQGMPDAIFSQFLSQVVIALDIAEKNEMREKLDRIEIADLPELESIEKKIRESNYTDETKAVINKELVASRVRCERVLLENMIANIDELGRKDLKNLANEIKQIQYTKSLVDEYVLKLESQNDILEEKELGQICSTMEMKKIEELISMKEEILKEGYKEEHYSKYFDMIDSRIEYLHLKNMEDACSNLHSASKDEVNQIKKIIDQEEVRNELKSKYYSDISVRMDQLDYEELCELTSNLESKSLEELEKLFLKIKNENYNEKYVKAFIVRTRIAMEQAQNQKVKQMIANIYNMELPDVLETRQTIKMLGYKYFIAGPTNAVVEERIYQLEMMELISINNDFDSLSFSEINNVRSIINQKNLLARSRETYLSKLKEREMTIAFTLVSQRACLAKTIADQSGVLSNKIVISTFDENYLQYLEKYFEWGGNQNYNNIPICFFPELAYLAITKTHIYYKVNDKYKSVLLSEIKNVTSEKKLLSESLIITRNKNEGIVIPCKGKQGQPIANFLLRLMENMDNNDALSRFQPYVNHIGNFTNDNLNVRHLSANTSFEYLMDNLKNQIGGMVKSGSLKTLLDDNWTQYEAKLRSGYEMNIAEKIIMYYDDSILKSAKEGVAFGERNIFIKNNNQPVEVISYLDLYDMKVSNSTLIIETTTNRNYNVNISGLPNITAKKTCGLIKDYAQGIQFLNGYVTQIKENPQIIRDAETEKICPVCGKNNKTTAKFCSSCGTPVNKVMEEQTQEFIFCGQCGHKMLSGKKFCSKCGTKVIYQ